MCAGVSSTVHLPTVGTIATRLAGPRKPYPAPLAGQLQVATPAGVSVVAACRTPAARTPPPPPTSGIPVAAPAATAVNAPPARRGAARDRRQRPILRSAAGRWLRATEIGVGARTRGLCGRRGRGGGGPGVGHCPGPPPSGADATTTAGGGGAAAWSRAHSSLVVGVPTGIDRVRHRRRPASCCPSQPSRVAVVVDPGCRDLCLLLAGVLPAVRRGRAVARLVCGVGRDGDGGGGDAVDGRAGDSPEGRCW